MNVPSDRSWENAIYFCFTWQALDRCADKSCRLAVKRSLDRDFKRRNFLQLHQMRQSDLGSRGRYLSCLLAYFKKCAGVEDMLRASTLTSALFLGAVAVSGGASAQGNVNIGNLSCTIDGGVGMILGSSRNGTCRFTPTGSERAYVYRANISRLGVDVGVTNRSFVRWLVFAPGVVKPGALAGTYTGVSAQATAGVGLGANVLLGGLRNSIALQPLSIQGQTGLNIAGGISRLRLRSPK